MHTLAPLNCSLQKHKSTMAYTTNSFKEVRQSAKTALKAVQGKIDETKKALKSKTSEEKPKKQPVKINDRHIVWFDQDIDKLKADAERRVYRADDDEREDEDEDD